MTVTLFKLAKLPRDPALNAAILGAAATFELSQPQEPGEPLVPINLVPPVNLVPPINLVPESFVLWARARKTFADCVEAQRWSELLAAERAMTVAMNAAFADPGRDRPRLLAELKRVLELYRRVAQMLPGLRLTDDSLRDASLADEK
jgi:hypothetical protein